MRPVVPATAGPEFVPDLFLKGHRPRAGLSEGAPLARALMDLNMMPLHQSTESDCGPQNQGREELDGGPLKIAI